jgi:hypothetical protein
MDAAYRTPLLDLFRRGEVPHDVRVLAARGILAPRAHEQVALLMLLVTDDDAGVRLAAEETLARIPLPPLAAFLARPDVADDVREFFAARGISPAAATDELTGSADEPMVETPDPPPEPGSERLGVHERLARLTVVDRLKTAMRGSREERVILIRDHNKIVAAAVLSNPRVNDSEVEGFARMPNVSEEVLRTIGNTRAWVKNYGTVLALARNPKTPVAISLTLLPRLIERDVKLLSADRNVPEALRVVARRMLFVENARRR